MKHPLKINGIFFQDWTNWHAYISVLIFIDMVCWVSCNWYLRRYILLLQLQILNVITNLRMCKWFLPDSFRFEKGRNIIICINPNASGIWDTLASKYGEICNMEFFWSLRSNSRSWYYTATWNQVTEAQHCTATPLARKRQDYPLWINDNRLPGKTPWTITFEDPCSN